MEDGETAPPLDYEDFISALMYYGHMSKDEIMHSSRRFLVGVYRASTRRACENLGVPYSGEESETDNTTPLSEADYPKDFGRIAPSKKQRKEAAEKFDSDEDFLSGFTRFNRDKYTNEMTFADKRSADREIIL